VEISFITAAYCWPTSSMGSSKLSASVTVKTTLPVSLPYPPSRLDPLTDSDPMVGGPLLRFAPPTGRRDERHTLLQSRSISGLIANRHAQTMAVLTSTEVQCDIVTKSHEKSADQRRGRINMARSSEMTQTLRQDQSQTTKNPSTVPAWTIGDALEHTRSPVRR